MPELAVLIPTRGRPGNIRKVIGAWDFTCAWDAADMVLIVDADDPEIGGYRAIQEETRNPDTGEPLIHVATIGTWLPMVHKLNQIAGIWAEHGEYFALGFAGDDHLPQTINWAKRYLTVLHELGTGMVYGDDGYQGKKLSTEWAITSDVVRELGRMVPAPVEHMYCDNSMMDLFGGAGALRYLPEVRIEHMHPAAGKADTDEQYRRVNHRDQFKKDRRAYELWQNAGMASDVATVRALRGDRPEIHPEPGRSRLTPGSRPRRVQMRSRPSSERKATMSNRLPTPKGLRKVVGATPDEIGLTLADFAIRVPADQAIVEIGVYQGRTALLMAWGAKQGNGAHVYAIDPWELAGNVYDPPFTDADTRRWAEYNVVSTGYSRQVTLIQAFSQSVSDNWGTGQTKDVGLLFVDGDHTKDGAKRDILGWAPHLAPGAVIAIDDYHHPDWPGVAEAVDELVDEGVLETPEIFHSRLAVTRLTVREKWATTGHAAEPIEKADTQVSSPDWENGDNDPEDGPVTAITSEGVSPAPTGPDFTPQWQTEGPGSWNIVKAGELEGVEAGTEVTGMNLVHLKALAKSRGIVLGARKDKRDLILQALRDGK